MWIIVVVMCIALTSTIFNPSLTLARDNDQSLQSYPTWEYLTVACCNGYRVIIADPLAQDTQRALDKLADELVDTIGENPAIFTSIYLDFLGSLGWELIDIVPIGTTGNMLFIFKRPLLNQSNTTL